MKVGGKCDARHLKSRVARLLDIRQRNYVMSYVHVFDTACDYNIDSQLYTIYIFLLLLFEKEDQNFSLIGRPDKLARSTCEISGGTSSIQTCI